MSKSLSPSLEDYLETILQLSEENGTAKISDIARRLQIAKPSATKAVALLRREGLVTQIPYGPISLTEKGLVKAQEVWKRHQTIRRFLVEILKVQPTVADKDACLMEHIISRETVSHMADWLGESSAAIPGLKLTLDRLLPGKRARVAAVQGENTAVKQRILEMGLITGAELTIERIAPLGYPIEIKIQDFYLSLRREEAALVLVELI